MSKLFRQVIRDRAAELGKEVMWPDEDYGVETCANGDVRIKLGLVQPFEIPADQAVKLAALLLKKAGCEVLINKGVITAVYRKVKVDLQ